MTQKKKKPKIKRFHFCFGFAPYLPRTELSRESLGSNTVKVNEANCVTALRLQRDQVYGDGPSVTQTNSSLFQMTVLATVTTHLH